MAEPKKQTTKAADQTPAILVMQKTIADSVMQRIQQFTANKDIRLPADYSPENALKSAWLILLETRTSKADGEKPVLEACTRESIANSLLNMVLQGLNPVKKQCAFIAFKDKLTMLREYHGTIALAKRYANIQEPVGNVIYEDDEFEYSIGINGYKKIIKHEQKIENIDMNKIKGAYATLLFEDHERQPYVEIMTMEQIRKAWMQGATKGDSPAHKNFPDEMSKKTVISRACKLFITSSDDSALFDDEEMDQAAIAARERIALNANKEEIAMDALDVGAPPEKKKQETKKEDIPLDPGAPEIINMEAGTNRKTSETLFEADKKQATSPSF